MSRSANLRGSLFMILSMAGFALEDMLYKSATLSLPPGQALMLFGLGGTAVFAALAHRQGQPVLTRAYLSRGLMTRSGIELGGRLFYALALAHADLATTSAILQSTPLIVTLGAVLLFGESVGRWRWLAMVTGFCGVLMVLRPGTDAFTIGSVFAVLGTLGFAGRDLATRAAPPSVGNLQLGVLGFAVMTLAGLVIHLVAGEQMQRPGLDAAGLLLATVVFGVIGYGSLTVAMRAGDVAVVAPFRYTRLVFALILAALVFGERPDALTLIGAAVIVASGLVTLLRSRAGRAD